MKKLLEGEAGNRSVVITLSDQGDTAFVTHCWKRNNGGTRYQLEFNYSFDIELSEVYRLAALWINKDFQNRMRVEQYNEKELAAIEKTTISVKDMYAKKERGPRDPMKAAQTLIGKLTKEQVMKLFADAQVDEEAS